MAVASERDRALEEVRNSKAETQRVQEALNGARQETQRAQDVLNGVRQQHATEAEQWKAAVTQLQEKASKADFYGNKLREAEVEFNNKSNEWDGMKKRAVQEHERALAELTRSHDMQLEASKQRDQNARLEEQKNAQTQLEAQQVRFQAMYDQEIARIGQEVQADSKRWSDMVTSLQSQCQQWQAHHQENIANANVGDAARKHIEKLTQDLQSEQKRAAIAREAQSAATGDAQWLRETVARLHGEHAELQEKNRN